MRNTVSVAVLDNSVAKSVQFHLMKGLLDLIVLQFLNGQPMHGYQIITTIRKSLGVYLGPSTVYPLLNVLLKKGYVTSHWDTSTARPRKVYEITAKGQSLLRYSENILNTIRQKTGLE